MRTRYENLDLLPAKISLAEVELSALNVDAPYVMRDALESVKNKYDAVVIDCPPSLSIFTINALGSAGFVVIPLQAEKFSIDGIKGLQGTIEGIKRRINPELKILGALIHFRKQYSAHENNPTCDTELFPGVQHLDLDPRHRGQKPLFTALAFRL